MYKWIMLVCLYLGAQAGFAQDEFEDKGVGACIAGHKETSLLFLPDPESVPISQLTKINVMTKCIKWADRKGKDPCKCKIKACSGITIPTSWADIADAIFDKLAEKIFECKTPVDNQ